MRIFLFITLSSLASVSTCLGPSNPTIKNDQSFGEKVCKSLIQTRNYYQNILHTVLQDFEIYPQDDLDNNQDDAKTIIVKKSFWLCLFGTEDAFVIATTKAKDNAEITTVKISTEPQKAEFINLWKNSFPRESFTQNNDGKNIPLGFPPFAQNLALPKIVWSSIEKFNVFLKNTTSADNDGFLPLISIISTINYSLKQLNAKTDTRMKCLNYEHLAIAQKKYINPTVERGKIEALIPHHFDPPAFDVDEDKKYHKGTDLDSDEGSIDDEFVLVGKEDIR